MKKMAILVIMTLPLLMAGCFGDEGAADLGWTNDYNSDGTVTKVFWQSSGTYGGSADQTWSTGIDQEGTSSLKPVNILDGHVYADLDPDSGGAIIEDAQLTLTEGGGNNISLVEGSSDRYNILVEATARKK